MSGGLQMATRDKPGAEAYVDKARPNHTMLRDHAPRWSHGRRNHSELRTVI